MIGGSISFVSSIEFVKPDSKKKRANHLSLLIKALRIYNCPFLCWRAIFRLSLSSSKRTYVGLSFTARKLLAGRSCSSLNFWYSSTISIHLSSKHSSVFLFLSQCFEFQLFFVTLFLTSSQCHRSNIFRCNQKSGLVPALFVLFFLFLFLYFVFLRIISSSNCSKSENSSTTPDAPLIVLLTARCSFLLDAVFHVMF